MPNKTRKPAKAAKPSKPVHRVRLTEQATPTKRGQPDKPMTRTFVLFGADEFGWVSPPVLNSQTRVAVEMCPGTGALRVIGYEPADGAGLPEPVARIYDEAVAA